MSLVVTCRVAYASRLSGINDIKAILIGQAGIALVRLKLHYQRGIAMELPRLREWRRRRALTQRELAARANIGYTTINRLEQGLQKAHPGTARRIADALEVLPDDLQRPTEPGIQREFQGDLDSPKMPSQLMTSAPIRIAESGTGSGLGGAELEKILSARFRLVQESPGVIYLVEIDDESQES